MEQKKLSDTINFIRAIIFLPMAGMLLFICMVLIFEVLKIAVYLAGQEIYTPIFIADYLWGAVVVFAVAVLFLRLALGKKMQINYGPIAAFLTVCLIGGGVLSYWSYEKIQSWEQVSYVPYIDSLPTRQLSQNISCDYQGKSTIYFEGSFEFLSGGFRELKDVSVQYDELCTDKYRVKIYYKGADAEMNVSTTDDDGTKKEYISIWQKEHGYELTAEDYAYMYKNKVNLEYSSRLAVEKIVIFTAYPEKINIEGMVD